MIEQKFLKPGRKEMRSDGGQIYLADGLGKRSRTEVDLC